MKKRGLLILLLLLLIGSVAWNVIQFQQSHQAKENLKQQEEAFASLNHTKDSLLAELEKLQEELQIVWDENALGVNKITELEAFSQEQEARIQSLRRRIASSGNTGDIKKLTLEIENIKKEKEILAQADKTKEEKIEALKLVNSNLAGEKKELSQNLEQKEALLKKGQMPNYNALKITPIRIRKDKKEIAEKAKHVSYLEIKLNMFANPITTEPIQVPIKLRIILPDGAIMSKTAKTLTDKDKIFTVEEIVTFSGKENKLQWDYKHNSDYQKGVHRYELMAGDDLIQVGSFELN